MICIMIRSTLIVIWTVKHWIRHVLKSRNLEVGEGAFWHQAGANHIENIVKALLNAPNQFAKLQVRQYTIWYVYWFCILYSLHCYLNTNWRYFETNLEIWIWLQEVRILVHHLQAHQTTMEVLNFVVVFWRKYYTHQR